jgi:2'-5' RNA ligase
MKPLMIDIITAYAKDGASKGCLMAMLGNSDACDITSFAKTNISDENLAPDGREAEPHVTVLYGFHPDFDIAPLESSLSNQCCLDYTLGAVSRFECPEYDVLKIEANGDSSQKLHYALRNQFSESVAVTHPVYHPHVTLGYVKKGAHKELDGNTTFQGRNIKVDSLTYSYPNKESRKEIKLKS